MKNSSKRLIIRLIIILVVLILFAGCAFAGFIFLRHEQRQNADITDALTIGKEAKRTLDEVEPDPEYYSLWSDTEKGIGRVFAEQCSLSGFQKLACNQDISMLVVGDSIGAQQWPANVASWIEDNYGVNCTLKNISLGGNVSYSGFTTLLRLDDGCSYDLIIVCYGQNDPDMEFGEDYEALLRLALEKYTGSSVLSVLESSQREYTSKMQTIRRIADYYSVPVADTIRAFNESGSSYESLSGDGVHPNEAGQELYALTVEGIISSFVAEEATQRDALLLSSLAEGQPLDFSRFDAAKTLPDPISESVEEYSRFHYYPASAFSRVGSTEWQICLKGVSGKLGIDKGRCHEYNDFQVFLDDQEIYSEEDYQTLDYNLRRISRMTYSSLSLDGTLKIHFYSDVCADAFYGLVITDYKEKE